MKQPIYVEANMVWVSGAKDAMEGHTIIGRDQERYIVTPLVWPDTTVQAITNQMREITHEIAAQITAMPEDERLQYVISVARRRPVPAYLRHFRLSEEAVGNVDNLNRTRPPRQHWDVSEQVAHGVWGADLSTLDTQLFDAPASQEDVLRMFIALRWVIQAGTKMSADQRTQAFRGFGMLLQPGDVSDEDL